MQITKTDYLEYIFCKKNLWLKKHKPELFDGVELSDFEKKIIGEGNEADKAAQNLFPSGVLIDCYGQEAINLTKQYLKEEQKTIFQATFSKDVFFIRADILVYNKENNGYELYEVKASNSIKRDKNHNHIKDLAFQKNVIEESGLNIIKASIIHLNKNYKRNGEIDYNALFIISDITDEVLEVQEGVREQMSNMKQYLNAPEQKGCECIYRGRSSQCTTFAYSNPDVPEYSVHDLNSIGKSKVLLTNWIDIGIYAINEINNPEKLKGIKKFQYDAYIQNKVLINKSKIKEALDKLVFPLYFFDYEGFVSAIPMFDGFGPYEQIPFQYSLHVMQKNGDIEHREFLITNPAGDITRPLIERIMQDINPSGTVIAWYTSYEKQRNSKLAELHPDCADFLERINKNMFDLMKIFSKNYYVDPLFRGSSSIKKVLPVIMPELTYQDFNISKGDQASERWEKMISKNTSEKEKKQIKKDLLEYCKMDTWAMVEIYRFLKKITKH